MPHCSIEHSAGLERECDLTALCVQIEDAILGTGLAELGGVRVRAIACVHFAVADRHPDNAFVDMSLRIGRGRTPDEKRRLGEAIYAEASAFFSQRLKSPHFALSLEVREIDAELSWKTNSIHPRLRAGKGK